MCFCSCGAGGGAMFLGGFFCGGSLSAEVVEVLALYVPIFLSDL